MKRLLLLALVLPACAHRAPAPPPADARASAASAAPAAGPAPDLSALREGADAVLRAQAEAYWRAFTEGEPADAAGAWRGREALLSDASLARVAAAVEASRGEARRGASHLRAWLLGERLARDASEAIAAAARAREEATFSAAGHDVPLGQAAALLAAERDPARRRALARAASASARALAPLAAARDERLRQAASALGYADPLVLAGDLRGEAPAALGALAEAVLASTDATWRKLLGQLAERDGVALADVRACDLPRLLRSAVPARAFPADRQLEAAAAVLAGLGIDLAAQRSLRVDAGARPGKLAHAIALPVDPPRDVRLSATPVAGLEALRGLLHELGAAEYYAHVGGAEVEHRRLGSPAVTQAWALLLEEVAGSPEWLAQQGLDEERARAEARAAAARRLLRAREASARLLAALARARAPAAPGAEVELAARAMGVPADEADLLAWQLEPDPLLRSAEALRAELLAAQAELFLSQRAGSPAWWRGAASGGWLAGAWAQGGRRSPEEVSLALGQPGLDARALQAVVRTRAGL